MLASSLLGALLISQALLTLFSQLGCGGDNLHLLGNDNHANDNAQASPSFAPTPTVTPTPSATDTATPQSTPTQ